MASSIIHFAIAEFINTHYLQLTGKKREKFLLGSIIVDDYQIAEKQILGKPSMGKKISHFIKPGYNAEAKAPVDFSQWVPDIESFLQKYGTKLEDPFYLGYFAHLYADVKWWGEVIKDVVNECVTEINPQAEKIEDITNEEYLKWYRGTAGIYKEFDGSDISIPVLELGIQDRLRNRFPDFEKQDLAEFEIPELGDRELQGKALEKLKEKFLRIENETEEQKTFNVDFHGRIGYKKILGYIEESADEFIEYIQTNHIDIGVDLTKTNEDERED